MRAGADCLISEGPETITEPTGDKSGLRWSRKFDVNEKSAPRVTLTDESRSILIGAFTATSHGSCAADAGPMRVGRAARRAACDSSRNGATTVSGSEWSPCSCDGARLVGRGSNCSRIVHCTVWRIARSERTVDLRLTFRRPVMIKPATASPAHFCLTDVGAARRALPK